MVVGSQARRADGSDGIALMEIKGTKFDEREKGQFESKRTRREEEKVKCELQRTFIFLFRQDIHA